MLFSLLHNSWAATIFPMWKETKRVKWTVLGALMPLAIAFGVTFAVAQVVRLFGGKPTSAFPQQVYCSMVEQRLQGAAIP